MWNPLEKPNTLFNAHVGLMTDHIYTMRSEHNKEEALNEAVEGAILNWN